MTTTSLHTTVSALLVIVFVVAQTSFGQVRLSLAGLNAGLADRLEQNGAGVSTLVFYPEVHGGGEFFLPYFEWSIYWGYWNDRIQDAFLRDYEVRSSRGHIIGGRLAFLPRKAIPDFLLPIALFAGIAHHFITTTPVQWPCFVTFPRSDGTEQSNTFELGLRVYYDIPASLQIRVEGRQFFALSKEEYYTYMQNERRIYTVGLAMSF